MVILGTMASIEARNIDQRQNHDDAFFYHNRRNQFWRILQLVFEPKVPAKILSNSIEKKQFLNKWQIAIANIIQEIKIKKALSNDPSDRVIFEAYKEGNVQFKRVNKEFREILRTTPLFFTCSENKRIKSLIGEYFRRNQMSANTPIHFLLTPTRCNPRERSLGWKISLARAGLLTESVLVPEDFVKR